jgi:hypothetical protein
MNVAIISPLILWLWSIAHEMFEAGAVEHRYQVGWYVRDPRIEDTRKAGRFDWTYALQVSRAMLGIPQRPRP